MSSFELSYEEEEDVLEVTFETFDEHFARTIPLNDKIIIYTDLSFTAAWGISMYSYMRLLEVNETHLDGLRPLPEADARRLMNLLYAYPLAHFLEVLDPGELLARVKAPQLLALMCQ
jgi:hypothetical protein